MLEGKQLEEHNRCITSKVASILGLSSKKSKWQLFCEMRGDIEREKIEGDNILMGSCSELAADEFLRIKYGWQVEMPPEKGKHHPDYEFLFGLVDRFSPTLDGVKYVLEYKNFDKNYKDKWDTDVMSNLILPDTVLTQIYFYSMLWDMPAKAFICFGGNEVHLIDVPRNPDIEAYILKECLQFWEDLQARRYPEPDYKNKNTASLLAKVYNQPIGDYVDGTTEEMELANAFARLKSERKKLEE